MNEFDFMLANGLYIDTYNPKVKTDRWGNRSKYNPKECDSRERAAAKEKA